MLDPCARARTDARIARRTSENAEKLEVDALNMVRKLKTRKQLNRAEERDETDCLLARSEKPAHAAASLHLFHRNAPPGKSESTYLCSGRLLATES